MLVLCPLDLHADILHQGDGYWDQQKQQNRIGTKIRFFADGMVMQEVVVNQAGFGRNITPNTNDISIAASAMVSTCSCTH